VEEEKWWSAVELLNFFASGEGAMTSGCRLRGEEGEEVPVGFSLTKPGTGGGAGQTRMAETGSGRKVARAELGHMAK
jgi:hypothetical protein